MDKNEKKITAVMAAVMNYIVTEEEAVCMAGATGVPAGISAPPQSPVKLWGISGRQAQMQMRNLMQMRAFK